RGDGATGRFSISWPNFSSPPLLFAPSPRRPVAFALFPRHLIAPSPRRLRPFAERDEESLRPMQPDPVIVDVVIELFYLFEQTVIDFSHRYGGGHRRAVFFSQAIGGESIIAARSLAFELHHFAEIVVYLSARQVVLRVAEPPQILLR